MGRDFFDCAYIFEYLFLVIKMKKRKMITVWQWVGLTLFVYGLIITGVGIGNLFYSLPSSVLGNLNPPLWWGLIMTVGGIIFLFFTKRGK